MDEAPREARAAPIRAAIRDDRPVGPKLVRGRRPSQRPSVPPTPVFTWIVAWILAAALAAYYVRGWFGPLWIVALIILAALFAYRLRGWIGRFPFED